jgi:hypothetical protein
MRYAIYVLYFLAHLCHTDHKRARGIENLAVRKPPSVLRATRIKHVQKPFVGPKRAVKPNGVVQTRHHRDVANGRGTLGSAQQT